MSRIHYILSQQNLGVSETDKLDDPRLITEVIEAREALEDASSESEVDEIKNDVSGSCDTISIRYLPSADSSTGRIQATLKKIEHAVHLGSWDEAHREAVRLKYLRGIEAAAQSWPDTPPGDH